MTREERKALVMRVEAKKLHINAMTAEVKLKVKMNQQLFDTVAEIVSRQFGIAVEHLVGRTRHEEVVVARHAMVYLCRLACPYATIASIGKMFGRDHSTIVHSTRRCEELREVDPVYSLEFERCYKILQARIPAIPPRNMTEAQKNKERFNEMIMSRDLMMKFISAWDEYMVSADQKAFMETLAKLRARGAELGLRPTPTIQ